MPLIHSSAATQAHPFKEWNDICAKNNFKVKQAQSAVIQQMIILLRLIKKKL